MDDPDNFFRSFRSNITELCRRTHLTLHNEILDNYVCWNITESLWHILSDMSKYIDSYNGVLVEDVTRILRKYTAGSYLINMGYDPEGEYTHWFSVITDGEYCYTIEYYNEGIIMTTMNNEDFMRWIVDIMTGKIPERFYGAKLNKPEIVMEVYNRKAMNM